MTRPPRFSVLVPHHPQPQLQRQSIESIAQQTFDGPPPAIEVWVAQVAGQTLDLGRLPAHLRVQVVTPDSSQPAATCNQLLALAGGDCVAWCHAGDTFAPNKLQEQGSFLDEDGTIGGAFSFADFVDEAGQPDAAMAQALNLDLGEEELAHRMMVGNVLIASTAMLRRSTLQAIGPLDESMLFGHEFELWLRALLHSGLRVVPVPLSRCRLRAGEASEAVQRRVAQEGWQTITRHAGNLMRRWPPMPQTNFAFLQHVVALAQLSEDWQVAFDFLAVKRQTFGHDDDDCVTMLQCLMNQRRHQEARQLGEVLIDSDERVGPAARAQLSQMTASLGDPA